jgi:hypothetical protein
MSVNLNDFVSLSEFLLGLPFQPPLPLLTALDQDLANVYLTTLDSAYPAKAPNQPTPLEQLVGIWTGIQKLPPSQWTAAVNTQIMGNANFAELAQNLILAWYSGFHSYIGDNPTPPTPDPANYEQTLVWVLAQAHPMGVPLSFGYWQYAPQPQGTGA